MSGDTKPAESKIPSRRGQRRTPEVDDRDRAVVLATARRLVERDGAAALSVRRLASELGTSYQLVYTLFGGKEGLLDALFREGFASLEAACRAGPTTGSPTADLASLASAYRRFAYAHRELHALMFGRQAGFDPSPESQQAARRSFSVVYETAVRAFETSRTARRHFSSAEALARAAWSATHGHVVLELDSWFGPEPNAAERLQETVRALVEDADDALGGDAGAP